MQYSTHTVKLSEDFGLNLAVRWFGQEAIDSLPKLKAGPNRGKPKGTLRWMKTLSAGWSEWGQHPAKKGDIVWCWIGNKGPTEADRGFWLDRVQTLSGSYSVFMGPKNRERALRVTSE